MSGYNMPDGCNSFPGEFKDKPGLICPECGEEVENGWLAPDGKYYCELTHYYMFHSIRYCDICQQPINDVFYHGKGWVVCSEECRDEHNAQTAAD